MTEFVHPPKPKAAPRGRPFAPGQSGNPAGRPRGSRNKATLAVEAIVEARLTDLTEGAVARALAGDNAATRLLLKPYLSRRPVAEFELGEIETASDVRDASAAVLRAATAGVLDAKEAFALHRLVEARARLLGYVPPEAPPPLLQLQFEPRQPGDPHLPKLTPEDVQEALDPEFPELRGTPVRAALAAAPAELEPAAAPPVEMEPADAPSAPAAAPATDRSPSAEPRLGRRIVLDAPGAMRVREIRPWLIGQGLEPSVDDVVEPNRRTAQEPVIDRIEPHRPRPRNGPPEAISNPVFSAENS